MKTSVARALLLTASLAGLCLLTGCASGFERFYKPAPATPASVVTSSAPPTLLAVRDPELGAKQLTQSGYVLIGSSTFRGPYDLKFAQEALEQGKKVGAAVVLLKAELGDCNASLKDESGHCVFEQSGRQNYMVPIRAGNAFTTAYFASYWARLGP
jgi:hypothetical protein